MKIDCILCGKMGKIYDPSSDRDPIEGNKLRGLITCPLCNGNKSFNLSLSDEQIYLLYNERIIERTVERIKDNFYLDSEFFTKTIKNAMKDIFK